MLLKDLRTKNTCLLTKKLVKCYILGHKKTEALHLEF